MKRTLTTILAMIIALSLPFSISAAGTTNSTYTIDGTTIIFSETSSLTAEEQAAVAQLIASGNESSTTTYNLMCTLFGHKTTTESLTVIEHCVSDTAPRCLKSLQDLTTCSRCDYVNVEVLNSYYINCCD